MLKKKNTVYFTASIKYQINEAVTEVFLMLIYYMILQL